MGKSWEILWKRLITLKNQYGAVAEFCQKTGISRTAVDNWLDKKTSPSLDSLDRIADALGYKPDQLIKENGLPVSQPHSMHDCYEEIKKAIEFWEESHKKLWTAAEDK